MWSMVHVYFHLNGFIEDKYPDACPPLTVSAGDSQPDHDEGDVHQSCVLFCLI